MKKFNGPFILLIVLFIFISAQNSYSQISFSHSIGGSFYAAGDVGSPGFNYSPRINFIELDDELTISAGTHLGLWFAGNSREGASSFTLDLPLVVEINFGHGSHPDTRSDFGGFAGIGFGISTMGVEGEFSDGYNNAAGIVINGGVRGLIKERPVGARISYLINTKEDAVGVIGLGVFYTFGRY